MKQLLLLLSLVVLSVGCSKKKSFNQNPKLNNVGKSVILYDSHYSNDFVILQGSDGHEYMENDEGNDYVLLHYPGCVKCSKKDTIK